MRYARIEIANSVYDTDDKAVVLETIFGDVTVPKSKIILERERKETVQILVPSHVFWDQGFNPCQMVKGFIEDFDRATK